METNVVVSLVYLTLNGTLYRLEAFQDRVKADEYVDALKNEFDSGGKWHETHKNEWYRTNGLGTTDVIRVVDRKVNL